MEQIRTLVEEVNTRGHLCPLLKGNNISVTLSTEEENALLIIKDGKLSTSEWSDKKSDVYISGTKNIMMALINGEIKLRNASSNNQVKLHSTLRSALLLESVFFLAMPDKTEISK